jgi:hypothetical protein
MQMLYSVAVEMVVETTIFALDDLSEFLKNYVLAIKFFAKLKLIILIQSVFEKVKKWA